MTKKRIADLLKEEVEKANEPDPAPAEEPTQTTTANTDTEKKKASTTAGRTRKRTTTKTTATTKTTKAVAATKQSSSTAKAKTPDTAALEKQVAELDKALKQAQEQIVGLQDDLKTHQTRIFELKDELEASQKATTEKDEALVKAHEELETAKETIRQITAAQAASPAKEEEPPKRVVHGADLATNRSTLSLRNRRPSSYKPIPDYAIQRGEQNSMLSDDDIGWVD